MYIDVEYAAKLDSPCMHYAFYLLIVSRAKSFLISFVCGTPAVCQPSMVKFCSIKSKLQSMVGKITQLRYLREVCG